MKLDQESTRRLGARTISFILLIFLVVLTQAFFKISQRNGSYEYNTVSAMVVVECVKLLLCCGQLCYENGWNLASFIHCYKIVPLQLYLSYACLALFYAIYNQLIFSVMAVADPGTFTLFKSTTPAIVSFLNWAIFRQSFNQIQLYCIFIQLFGIISLSASSDSDKTYFTYGTSNLILILFTITFGSFNTVYNASVVKKSTELCPLYIQNSILYASGMVFNLVFYLLMRKQDDESFFYGYDHYGVIVLLILESFCGITISMIYKYGDALLKTFAQPISAAILVCISYLFFGMPLDISKASSAGVVVVSSLLYLKVSAEPDGNMKLPSRIENEVKALLDEESDRDI